jgi:hypothetical protein
VLESAACKYGNAVYLSKATPFQSHRFSKNVSGSGGYRKVRWTRRGMGKRGGVKVICFDEIEGRIWLLIVYAKS